MSEYSKFPNKLFDVGEFLDLKNAPDKLMAAVMSIKADIANGNYSSAAKTLNLNKNELKHYFVDSSYINYLDEELCELEKYVQTSGQQTVYSIEQPSCNENDSWIQSANLVYTPAQEGELIYDGTAQSPSWTNYDPNYLQIGGTYEGIYATTYFATFKPINGAKWWDTHTTESIRIPWRISPAEGHIDLQYGVLVLTADNPTATIEYSNNTGEVYVRSENPEVVTAELGSNNTIIVTRVANVYGYYNVVIGVEYSGDYLQHEETVQVAVNYDPSVIIDAVPTQSGTLRYNENEQTPSWDNFNSGVLDIEVTPEIYPGTYTATFTPKSDCKWWDGTKGGKTATWTILKGLSKITVSQNTVVLNNRNPDAEVTYTYTRNGAPLQYQGATGTGYSYTVYPSFIRFMSSQYISEEQIYTLRLYIEETSYYTAANQVITVRISPSTNIVINNVPRQAEELVYDGTMKGPVWEYYDSTQLIISNIYEAINAGTYIAKFTPRTGYMWSDGTRATKSVTWTMEKDTGSIDLSKYFARIAIGSPDTITVHEATGELSFDYDESLIYVSYSGSVITVSALQQVSETTIFYITAAESTNYKERTVQINVDIDGDIVISELPTQSNTLTYNEDQQSPTWNYHGFEDNLELTSGTTSSIDASIYTVYFTPKSGSRWWDGTKTEKSTTWRINKAQLEIDLDPTTITLVGADKYEDVDASIVDSGDELQTETHGGIIVDYVSPYTYRVTSIDNIEETASVIFTAPGDNNHLSASVTLTVIKHKTSGIYGITWDNGKTTNTSKWTRTDNAADFADPDLVNGTSPFDNIAPWSELKKVYKYECGYLVRIPRYYYSIEYMDDAVGTGYKIRISDSEFEGSHISPAHAARGDGKGTRPYVYVGAYQCNSSYGSTSNSIVAKSKTRDQFRTNIHTLGDGIYQWDFAMYWTIMLLYLVEFADWDAQSKIGLGYMIGASYADNTGKTDGLTYHTGSLNNHVRYRYLEDLWGNMKTFVDGIYYSGTATYVIKNPSQFSDTRNGTLIGNQYKKTDVESGSMISEYTIPSVSGYEYALIPAAVSTGINKYTTDALPITLSTSTSLAIGGAYSKDDTSGMFYGPFSFDSYSTASSSTTITSRLMYLP